jgi:hypothetical protein
VQRGQIVKGNGSIFLIGQAITWASVTFGSALAFHEVTFDNII